MNSVPELFLAILRGLPSTLTLTLAAFALGSLVAVPLCALRVCRVGYLRLAAALIILSVRSVPPIVWLMFIFFGISHSLFALSPTLAAVLGLGLITAVNMAEIYRGSLQAIPKGQSEASRVLGMSQRQRFRLITAPQVFRFSIPGGATFCIGLLKDSAIASVIGVAEISQVTAYLTQQTYRGLLLYAFSGLLYLALSFCLAAAFRRLQHVLRARIER
ncbi:amino acid ABC transporter permease [Pseudomonas putida]